MAVTVQEVQTMGEPDELPPLEQMIAELAVAYVEEVEARGETIRSFAAFTSKQREQLRAEEREAPGRMESRYRALLGKRAKPQPSERRSAAPPLIADDEPLSAEDRAFALRWCLVNSIRLSLPKEHPYCVWLSTEAIAEGVVPPVVWADGGRPPLRMTPSES